MQTNFPKRILGIDPGSRLTGYGIIEKQSQTSAVNLIACGVIRLQDKDINNRLGVLYHEISDILSNHTLTDVAIEQAFVSQNPSTALKLGQARGVLIAAVIHHNILMQEYAPRSVKQAIVGSGKADKAQVEHMVRAILKIKNNLQQDAADALAIALCHLYNLESLPNAYLKRGMARSKRYNSGWRNLKII